MGIFKIMNISNKKLNNGFRMLGKLSFVTSKMLEVLYFFASNPLREFHEREVVRKTGVSLGAVSRIVRKLRSEGLLARRKVGRMHLYKLNMRSAVARQFKVLFNVFLLDELVREIEENCERIVLFGSCAEGMDVKDSDVDLFVLTPNDAVVRNRISSFEKEIGRRISAIVLDSRGLAKMKNDDKPLYDRISRGIVLWERE